MKKLILISGPPGVGKSSLSKAIAQTLNVIHLDKDCVDEPFSPNDRGEYYTNNIEPKVIQALLNVAELNLNNGINVLIDMPWTHIVINNPELVHTLTALTQRTQSKLKIVELTIAEDELRARLEQRAFARDQSRLTEEGWQKFKITDCLGQIIPMAHYLVDATQSLDRYLPGVLQYINH